MPAQDPSAGSPQPLVQRDPGYAYFPPEEAVHENEGPQAQAKQRPLSPLLRSLLRALSTWPA